MKKTLISIICSSVLFASGCSNGLFDNDKNSSLVSGLSKENMDLSVRPQDNFYRYVNGGWINSHEIPSDKTSIGSFSDLNEQSTLDVKNIIETLSKTDDLVMGSDEQKVADLFRSFMDKSQRDELGIKPIQPILDAIKQLSTKQDVARFFGEYESKGIDNPLGFYIGVDAKDSSRYATHIWQNGLGLPDQDYYFNENARFISLRTAYIAHIEKMFDLAGFKNGKSAANVIFSIEKKLAEQHSSRVANRDSEKRYNKFKVSTLNKLTNKFDWATYLKAQGVAGQKDIIINQPDFIKGFGKIFSETSVDDWKTYLMFRTVNGFSSYLTTALDDEGFDFYSKQLNGQKKQREDWKRGVSVVNNNLGEVIGKLYVARHFTPEAKTRMAELVANLSAAYGESIDDLAWMSAKTKKAAHAKLALFDAKIGYPDKWQDYSTLNINKADLIGNVQRSLSFSHNKEVAKLGGPIDNKEWGMTPQTVNAYYNPPKNEIVFPAAILQPPFFNLAADDAVNYGGIGAVIGHEMGHAFDDQGSKYDGKGNLRNWWTKKDAAQFKKRTDALVAQYSNYAVFDDLNVNGKLTLGENIGDLSGVTIAYKAYKTSLNGKPAPIIDGLTGDQRFFMGFAQVWSSKVVEKAMRNRVATDPHSPGEFRALGTLSNVPEFYKAFDVKEGDAMYIVPEKRVKIW